MPGPARAYELWMEMWNGEVELAAEIFAPDCVAHPARMTAGEPPVVTGVEGMRQFVEQGRAIFDTVTFRAEDVPIVEGNRLACR